ncbi:MAG: hypothetical protein M9890_10255 [Thermomicrobiales bacterium]|nr:hypothetical protein [Thermomicrobiales bacterium]
MRNVWIIAPDQQRVEIATESGDEDAELRPTIDYIIDYSDPNEPPPDVPEAQDDGEPEDELMIDPSGRAE